MLRNILLSGLLLCFLLPGSIQAQSLAYAKLGFKRFDITQAPTLQFDTPVLLFEQENPEVTVLGSYTAMPQVWRYEDLAAFCKLDVQLDRIAPFNIRFRLGEVSYVDRLEKKGPTRPDYRR